MPEQSSSRNQPITTAPIESPFVTEVYPFGLGGLNLKDQKDQIPVGQFQVLTNLTHRNDRGLTARNGLTSLATAGTAHHSVRRLNSPRLTTYTRLWGVDQTLQMGQSGALTQIDTGYSGDPLYLVPHRPPLSGDPWMFVADRSRMRKVREDGLVLPIGLPQPVTPTTARGPALKAPICNFDISDGTSAPHWLSFEGFPPDANFADAGLELGGSLFDVPGVTGGAVEIDGLVTFSGITFTDPLPGWINGMGLAKTLDLSTFPASTTPITDDDALHLSLRINFPSAISEIRIYFVVSPYIAPFDGFPPWSLPGMGVGVFSPSAYLLTIRPSDYTNALADLETLQSAADRVRTAAFLETFADPVAAAIATAPSNEAAAGAGVWSTFSEVNLPVIRRGDLAKIGTAGQPGTDWSTFSGLYIVTQGVTEVPVNGTNWKVAFDDLYFTGGSGPDTESAGNQEYDYRVTNYDPRTGAESNPSLIQTGPTDAAATTPDLRIAALRQPILVQPAVFGDANIQQRIYRRGGTLIADWYFVGANTSDGALFTDTLTDDAIVDAGTVNIDHFQPVPTVDTNGNTVLAQPVGVIFGPANGLLFALGDPYRPGHLYWCVPDEPDHWPAESNFEVCSPSEELMVGFMIGPQPFCGSRERLYVIYPSLSGSTEVTVSTTGCKRGFVSRWAFTVAWGGVFGVAKDCIFYTSGGPEDVVSTEIQQLFRGQPWNGYSPIDFTAPTAIRLATFEDQIFFQYQGTDGNRHLLVYSLIFKFWSAWELGIQPNYVLPDEDTPIAQLFVGGLTTGTSYLSDPTAFSDVGTPITCTVRTGTWNLGRPREDKLLGDQIVDADLQGVSTATLTNRLNDESVVNPAQAFDTSTGRQRFIFDSFGPTPQRARNISTEISWASSTARPVLYFLGQSLIPEPDQTDNRVTQWDDLGHPDESYLTGVTFDCDTGGQNRTIIVEYDFGGTINQAATLTVNTAGRRKVKFSWSAVQVHKVRIHPSDTCVPWILYRVDWIAVPEPPRIAGWDIHFEAEGDQYYTGLDLYCDTGGAEKRIEVFVDGLQLTNTLAGLPYWPITTLGRQWKHLTLPWGRGHVFHFIAVDANPGLLYKHKWYVIPEPSEQANWNQPFSTHGTLADKWFKACLFEVDTFGQAKSVNVEVDGIVKEVLPVMTTGRQVVHLAFQNQYLGRVLRIFPVDGNPSRPYTITSLFDIEPYQLTRWETQETNHSIPGFQMVLEALITLKSSALVTLTVTTYLNQTGTIVSDAYQIASTGSVKDQRYVPFEARKGVLTKYVLTSSAPFWLYREESSVLVQRWGGDPEIRHPFGNDDLSLPTRDMISPDLAASRSGGGWGGAGRQP